MLAEKLSVLIDDYAAATGFSGVVAVRQGERMLCSLAYGHAHRGWNIANRTDTRFRIASVSKMFTAAAILQLVEAGKLDLDTPLAGLLGLDLTGLPAAATIEHALTMTAGIADWYDESGDWAAVWNDLIRRQPLSLLRSHRDYLALFGHKPPKAPVGAGHAYSNSSYILLGLAIEHASGMPYEDYVREMIFARLDMADSDFVAIDDIGPGVAEGYLPPQDGHGWRKNIHAITPTAAADGGATSTAADLLRFLDGLRGHRLLSPPMTAALLTPRVAEQAGTPRGYEWKYGYGATFLVEPGGPVVRYGHAGEEDGVSCRLYSYPASAIDLVILSNLSAAAGKLGWAIHDLLAPRPAGAA